MFQAHRINDSSLPSIYIYIYTVLKKTGCKERQWHHPLWVPQHETTLFHRCYSNDLDWALTAKRTATIVMESVAPIDAL